MGQRIHNDVAGPAGRVHSSVRSLRLRSLVLRGLLAATLMLVGTACGGDDGGETTSGGDGGDGLTVAITSPAAGAAVGESFDVEVDAGVPLDEPDTGEHHLHLYYDGETGEGTYDIVYGATFTVDRLEPGQHRVEAVIANADHSLTDARDEITVDVGAAPGDEAPATTSGDEAPAGRDGY